MVQDLPNLQRERLWRQCRLSVAGKEPFNAILDAVAEFRSIHYGWAQEYISRWTADPRGTGGTPYMKWLDQLIQETRSFKIL